MKVVLESLTLINFKGIRSLHIDFGWRTYIFGDNETGKTTVCDGFSWDLFDKDSQNKSSFNVKTLDQQNNPIHHLDHEVEAVLNIDGKRVKLRKVFTEKWTKKRGSSKSEFSGHTTDYFIDGVPTKANDFKAFVDSIVDEKLFRLLTNPAYFNTVLDWKARRETLLDVCGDVSTDDVIASNKELEPLSAILKGRHIDDHRKVIQHRMSEINKELEKLPVRIDEANRSKPDTDGLDQSDLKRKIEQFKSKIALKESEITRLQSGGEITVAENRVRELEGELLDIKNSAKTGAADGVAEQRKVVHALQENVHTAEADINRKRREIESNNEAIQEQDEKAQGLRERWAEVNAEVFEPHVDGTCAACGQALPDDQIEAAHQKALEEFNRNKSQRLEDIVKRGSAATEKANELKGQNQRIASEIEVHKDSVRDWNRQLETEQHKLESLQTQIVDVTKSPEYISKQEELERAKSRVSSLRASVLDDVERVRRDKMDLSDELSALETKLAYFAQVERIDKRIADLEVQEKQLSEEYERLEYELYLLDEFTKSHVALLESKINSKFKVARFKLFTEQINGGIQPTCETLYNGVPYSDMNNAARINVGLDIINTLSEHYSIHAPIFIDNAESVTQLYETDSQLVALYVSKPDKKLRVETYNNEQEAV